MNSGLPLICRMLKTMMPSVRRELARWRRLAEHIPDAELRAQALASIDLKSFHCLGGGVYALYPGADFEACVRFIVAFQTISDYLDNLCDRAGVADEEAFRRLHVSMQVAVDPDFGPRDYYRFYPRREDGGYLNALVQQCRELVSGLGSYPVVKEKMHALVSLYCELQALKHTVLDQREEKLKNWAEPLAQSWPGISVWEFCAAAGSTLGVFLLFAAASAPSLKPADAEALTSAYFPWVCGLHILLDYFIDSEEDEREGDFNFTSYYDGAEECSHRLAVFAGQSLAACAGLRHPGFHSTVVHGLLAMYLSDPKAAAQGNLSVSKATLKCGGARTLLYHRMCKALRKRGKL